MTDHEVRSITCAEADELAIMCVLDALTPAEAAPLHAHLATCAQPHESIVASASAAGALALSVDPVQPPDDLRARVMATIAGTPQVAPATGTPNAQAPAPVESEPPAPLPFRPPVSAPARPSRRARPDRLAWIGLAAAAVLAILLVGWNLSLQQQLSDRSHEVTALEARVAQAQQDAQDAGTRVASLEQELSDQQDDLTTALDRADRSEAQVATLRDQVASTEADLAVARQTLADSDARVALAGQAVAAAADPSSAMATLTSAQPGFGASGLAVFPTTGPGYVLLDGLPPLDPGTTYQAWYLADGTPTSAGLLVPGPQGLTVLGGLEPGSGTDTIALTVEPEGGVPLPTGPVVVAGQLPAALQG